MSAIRVIAEDCTGFWTRPRRSPEAVKGLQDSRLRRIVAHAWRTVPYFRRLFAEAGLDPRDIRGVSDLARIPPTSKEDLRRVPASERLVQGWNADRLVRHMTSGSAGEPMPVLRTRAEEALVHAYQLRAQVVCGVPLRARRAKVGRTFSSALPHRLGVLPTISIDATRRTPESILEELRRWRPDCLDIRPGVLEPLVEAAARDGRGGWSWRWMVSGGEVLFPDLRRRAEEVFGARILDRYGAHEFGQIAWRCVHCGFMHTNDDSVVVEIEHDGRTAAPGERGDILATGLLSFAMPFLRFRLGDIVEQGPAGNGSGCPFGFASIGTIEGRRLDNLTLADGRSVPTYNLMAVLRQTAGVQRFEIVQESFHEIRIRYVRASEGASDPGPELERRLLEALPSVVKVTVEPVDRIEPAESGKYHYIRSLVGQPSGG